jgi:NAD(P)-dependent dehydrogenase (short-subunit alcohol dehydrogenase family)
VSDLGESFRGKSVLLTGASRGIGAATAAALSRTGATVIRVSRSDMPALANAVDFRADLADARERDAILRLVSQRHGTPDVVISNAGAFMIAPIEDTTDALLREQLAINLEAPFAIARHFLPAMRTRGHGTHVILGSIADHQAFPGNAAYAAAKFGVRGLHQVLRQEFRGTGVRCILVSPGPTDTAAWDPVDPDNQHGFTPRADMLRPDDVATAILQAIAAPPHVEVDTIRLGPV